MKKLGHEVSRKPGILLLVGILAVSSGCDTCNQTRILSALVGAGAGAALGGALGKGQGAGIGAAAGAAAGLLVAEFICLEQRRKAAQKAAEQSKVEDADRVVKKYEAYNRQLEDYVTKAKASAQEIQSGKLEGEKLDQVKKDTAEQSAKAQAGAKDSLEAIQRFSEKVDAAQATTADEAKRQELLAKNAQLQKQAEQLLAQYQALTEVQQQARGS